MELDHPRLALAGSIEHENDKGAARVGFHTGIQLVE